MKQILAIVILFFVFFSSQASAVIRERNLARANTDVLSVLYISKNYEDKSSWDSENGYDEDTVYLRIEIKNESASVQDFYCFVNDLSSSFHRIQVTTQEKKYEKQVHGWRVGNVFEPMYILANRYKQEGRIAPEPPVSFLKKILARNYSSDPSRIRDEDIQQVIVDILNSDDLPRLSINRPFLEDYLAEYREIDTDIEIVFERRSKASAQLLFGGKGANIEYRGDANEFAHKILRISDRRLNEGESW